MEDRALVLNDVQIKQKIDRITRQIIENNYTEKQLIIAGINGNGFSIAQKIHSIIQEIGSVPSLLSEIKIDKVNPTDETTSLTLASSDVKDSVVLLIDDVINSGMTMSYAFRYILELKPKSIQTAVLIDRKHRKFPIRSNYTGKELSTMLHERVEVSIEGNQMEAVLI